MPQTIPFRQALRVWTRIGLLSFGGPAAQIALMHREVVEDRGWIAEEDFVNGLGFCMVLPGPEAMQLATYIGWRLHGTKGGLAAGLLFVLPGALVILALAALYLQFGQLTPVTALFLGIKAAVIAIVIDAMRKLAGRTLHRAPHWIIAGLAFLAIHAFDLPFPLILAAAALTGTILFHRPKDSAKPHPPSRAAPHTLRTVAIWLAIWWLPLGLLALTNQTLLADLGLFFSRLAVVTFGGAYAVLAYMAQGAVADMGWLATSEMIDGLGLAETTPGPLILVTEFVGFVAAAKAAGPWAGLAGAVVALWATFVPCFLWIFAGAPHIARLTAAPRLQAALEGITAAVVGVILNLSLWFALNVLFQTLTKTPVGPAHVWVPDLGSLNGLALSVAILSAVLLIRRKWPVPAVIATAAAITGTGALF